MKTILGIVGSPRPRGNTSLLVSEVLAGATEAGAAADLVLLGDLTIRECDGCHACWAGKPCPKNDDMNALYPRIAAADAVLFGTPVYWYGPTALMKGLVDRLVYFNGPAHHAEIKGKAAALVVPFEEEAPETASLLIGFFEKSLAYLEMPLLAHLLVPGVTRRGEVAGKESVMAEARALGRRLGGVL
jgi:multimeric flavodoxin WrbA